MFVSSALETDSNESIPFRTDLPDAWNFIQILIQNGVFELS